MILIKKNLVFVSFLLVFFTTSAFAQSPSKQELVLQTYHSGNILDFDTDQMGTKMVSIGEDKNILFYDLTMRLIYKRIALPDSVSSEHLAIDHSGQQLVSMENLSLVYRNLNTGSFIQRINLKPVFKSLNLNVDPYFFEANQENNTLALLGTFKDKNSYRDNRAKVLLFDLTSGKLNWVSPEITMDDQINDFTVQGDHLFVLSSQKGLLDINIKDNAIKTVWTPANAEDIPASLQCTGDKIWLLTNKNLYLLSQADWKPIKVYPQHLGNNVILKRNHPFVASAEGDAYLYNGNTLKLEGYSTTQPFTMDIAPDAYMPVKLKTVKGKNYLFVNDGDELIVLNYRQRTLLLKQKNSLTNVGNWQFYKPGIAYAAIPDQDAFVQVDFTRGLVSRLPAADKDFYIHKQLFELPKSALRVASNGYYVKFMDGATNEFKFGISVPQKTFVSEENKKLNFGASRGETSVYFSEDESIMVSPVNLGIGILVWDLKNKKLLHEIDLKPADSPGEGRNQIIDHIAFHPGEKLIYIETSNNAMGNVESLVADALTGKIIFRDQIKFTTAFHGNFYPRQRKVIIPAAENHESRILDLQTMQSEVVPFKMESVQISNDEQEIFFTSNDGIYSYHTGTKVKKLLGIQPNVEKLVLDAGSELLISTDRDNTVQIWNSKEGILKATLLLQIPENKTEQPAYIFISSDFYYMGGGNYSNLVLLSKDDVIMPLEQFDRMYNRPDLILKAIGTASPELIEQLTKATMRRTKSVQLADVKNFKAVIENKSAFSLQTDNSTVTIKGKVSASANPVTAYQVWLNGVALYPEKPKTIDNSGSTASVLEVLKLTEETNRIELAFWDSKGNESSHDLLVISLPSPPKPSLWLVGLGVSQYENPDFNLRYAGKDIEDVTTFLKSAKAFKKVNTLLLKDSQVIKSVFTQIDQFLSSAAPEDIAMIFYAGHGLLDKQYKYFLASHTMDFTDPAAKGIPVELFEKALYSTQARKKILLIDACHSGLVEEPIIISANISDEQKNIKQTGRGGAVTNNGTAQTDTEVLQSAFLNLDKGQGITIISASSGSELAYEDSQLQNGLFTYSFLEGIKSGNADLNKNEQISLSELKSFVEKRVVELSNGKQRPTNRRWNSYLDFPVWYSKDKVDEQFFAAARTNDTVSISKLLKAGYSVNLTEDRTGFTPLAYAARNNQLLALRQLIKAGANLESKSLSPLYLAVYNNHVAAAYYLIISGAKVKDETFFYEAKGKLSLEQIALAKENPWLAELLTKADIMRKNDPIYRGSIQDIFKNSMADLEARLKDQTIDLNFVIPDFGVSLIYFAIQQKNPDMVSYFLEKGAAVNNIPNSTFSPLHMAAYFGNEQIVNLLLKAGADKKVKDYNGKIAADYVQESNLSLKALLE